MSNRGGTALGLLALIGAATLSITGCQTAQALTSDEERFIRAATEEPVALPGSPMAEAHPKTVTEHLSWKWPDDETLVANGHKYCEVARESVAGNPAMATKQMPFLADYSFNQRMAFASAANDWLCPDV